MPERSDVIYRYDATFDGFLSCVFEAYVHKETPMLIDGSGAPTLFSARSIASDHAHAARVKAGIRQKIGPDALDLIQAAFLTCLADKELALLRFIRLGLSTGRPIMRMLASDTVAPIWQAVQRRESEAHHFKGFLRFSDAEGILYAAISPKNDILDLLAPHFADRLNAETFLIYDRTHQKALLSQNGQCVICPARDFTPPAPNASEQKCRALWKAFFDTIAIQSRINPVCQNTHLPKRFRGDMTEFVTAPRQNEQTQLNP